MSRVIPAADGDTELGDEQRLVRHIGVMHTLREQIEFALQYGVPAPFVLVALFPRLARVTRAPGYEGLKGVAVHTTYKASFHYGMHFVLKPRIGAWAEREQLARGALTERLGREPTVEEAMEDLQRRRRERTRR